MSAPQAADRAKACCAAAYGSDLVALLLGDSHHPGGAALTRRLAGLAGRVTGDARPPLLAGRGLPARLRVRGQ